MDGVVMVVAIVIPAKDEELTVREVARAAVAACRVLGGHVVVVADNCSDGTALEADKAGASVLELQTQSPSKAHAVRAGIKHLDAESDNVVLLDADCVGLTPLHVERLCIPVFDGKASMSVGIFDYPFPFGPLVVRVPWSTGQRAFAPGLFPIDDPRLDGYNLELLLNEAVGKCNGTTVAQVMRGLHHRSKVAKAGVRKGIPRNLAMWTAIAESANDIDRNAYKRYLARLVVMSGGRIHPPARALAVAGLVSLEAAGVVLRAWAAA